MGKASNENYSDEEAARRVESALRAAFSAPHRTYEESKIGKRRAAARKSPVGRSRRPPKK